MRLAATVLGHSLALCAGAVPLCAAAQANVAVQPPERICERDPTRLSCEVSGRGRTGPKATPETAAAVPSVVVSTPSVVVCERDPTRLSCEVSGRGRTLGAAPQVRMSESVKEGGARGALVGSMGGLAVGASSCTPMAWLPQWYGLCVLGVTAIGALGGTAVGLVASDIAARSPKAAEAEKSSVPVPAETFDQALARAAAEKEHSAVAIAVGERQWVWGVAGGMTTQDEARGRALDLCNRHAARDGVHAACAIYQLDGNYTALLVE